MRPRHNVTNICKQCNLPDQTFCLLRGTSRFFSTICDVRQRPFCLFSLQFVLDLTAIDQSYFVRLSAASATEYCLTESFIAQCPDHEMILVERALFGRMELGRCVTRNYGHLGCSVDVLSYVDAACSGLRQCELSVSDPVLVRTKPCPPDFSSYLDATYRCVPGNSKTIIPAVKAPSREGAPNREGAPSPS
jgi:Galactose binding lectin domain